MTAMITPGTIEATGAALHPPPANSSSAMATAPSTAQGPDGAPRVGTIPRGLACPPQSFAARFTDLRAPGLTPDAATRRIRAVAVAGSLALTALLLLATQAALPTGLSPAAGTAILVLTAAGLLPVAVGLVLALIGMARPAVDLPSPLTLPRPPALKVALLLPVHEEDTAHVFGNAAAMLDDLSLQPLRRAGGRHEFALFILSDTRTDACAIAEARAAAVLRHEAPPGIRVHYRRRLAPVDRKLGNLRDWVETHGADWAAMIVLDADSLMSGRALVQLTDALASDPSAGLIQSVPRIIGARTLFARLQAFSHAAHGGPVAAGFAAVCSDAGNYFGHNAILRTQAFADAATLPALPGLVRRSRTALILSHDFVEAALLRRAGWGVRVLPGITESYEETPPTLVDHALRDRRWCRGNLQHLRLLGAAGLHPLSRVHLGLGALAYLAAPAWLLLVAGWAMAATGAGAAPAMAGMVAAGGALAMLVLPRMLALFARGPERPRALSVFGALVLSTLFAPVQLVQLALAVLRAVLGLRQGWAPQNRTSDRLPLAQVIAFHRTETALGALMLGAIATGLASPWLAAIALPLAAAVPLSLAGSASVSAFATPDDLAPPAILRAAQTQRARLREFLGGDGTWTAPTGLAAE